MYKTTSDREVEIRDLTFEERGEIKNQPIEFSEKGDTIIHDSWPLHIKTCRYAIEEIDGNPVTDDLLNSLSDAEVLEISREVQLRASLGYKKK